MTTSVISLKGRIREFGASLERAPEGVIYIGRINVRGRANGGWNLKASPFANRHSVKKFGLAGSLARFRQDLRDHPELVEQLRALAGSTFACWCGDGAGPDECHAGVCAFVADGGAP